MKLASCSFTLIFDWVGYFALLLIAIYIIQKDQVWEKFTSRKSSYARYQEPITERPTIVIKIESSLLCLEFGIHYAIWYFAEDDPAQQLQIGVNKIMNDEVTIE